MRVGLREANQRFSQLVRAVKLGREVIQLAPLRLLDAIHIALCARRPGDG